MVIIIYLPNEIFKRKKKNHVFFAGWVPAGFNGAGMGFKILYPQWVRGRYEMGKFSAGR